MSDDLFNKGSELRRRVLGEEYVRNTLKGTTSFNQPFQVLVTEYCWGKVWSREGLSLRDRSIINLALLSALNRPHELKIHVRGALRNGVTREEISEILLQVTIYAGVPAGLDAFRVASEVLSEVAVPIGQ